MSDGEVDTSTIGGEAVQLRKELELTPRNQLPEWVQDAEDEAMLTADFIIDELAGDRFGIELSLGARSMIRIASQGAARQIATDSYVKGTKVAEVQDGAKDDQQTQEGGNNG